MFTHGCAIPTECDFSELSRAETDSSVLRLDQPNCYAYLDLKGNYLSNVHET